MSHNEHQTNQDISETTSFATCPPSSHSELPLTIDTTIKKDTDINSSATEGGKCTTAGSGSGGKFASGFFQTISNTFKISSNSSNQNGNNTQCIEDLTRTIKDQKLKSTLRCDSMQTILNQCSYQNNFIPSDHEFRRSSASNFKVPSAVSNDLGDKSAAVNTTELTTTIYTQSISGRIPSNLWTSGNLSNLLNPTRQKDKVRKIVLEFLELLCHLNEYDEFMISGFESEDGNEQLYMGYGYSSYGYDDLSKPRSTVENTKESRSIGYLYDLIENFANNNGTASSQKVATSILDPQFSLILRIMQRLTNEGTFIFMQSHSQEVKSSTMGFILDVLKCSDVHMVKSSEKGEKLIIPFLRFVENCVESGILDSISCENLEDNDKDNELLSLIFKICRKTSDRLVLRQSLLVMNSILLHANSSFSVSRYSSISKIQLQTMLEIITNSMILDLQFYELGSESIVNMIGHSKFEEVYYLLVDIIGCRNTEKGEGRNINASIGAMKFLISLLNGETPSTSSSILVISLQNVDMMKLVLTLMEISRWNKVELNCMVLQVLERVIFNNLSVIQSTINMDKNTDLCGLLLNILRNITGDLRKTVNNSEKQIVELSLQTKHLIGSTIQGLLDSSTYPGNIKELIINFLLSEDIQPLLSVKNSLFVIRWFVNEGLLLPSNNEWKINVELLMRVFFHAEQRDVSLRLNMLQTLRGTLDSLLLITTKDDISEGFQSTNLVFFSDLLFQILTSDSESTEIVNFSCEQLFDICEKNIDFSSTGDDILFIFWLSRYIQEKLADIPLSNLITITKGLITLFLRMIFKESGTDTLTRSTVYLYELLILITKHALASKGKSTDLLLLTCRFFIRLRSSTENEVYLTNPRDIDGLSAAFARNVNLRSTTTTLDEKWKYPEEVDYIPNSILDMPSSFLKYLGDDEKGIDISKWLSIVVEIISTAPNWETYSFVYCYFCPQLSNVSLFTSNSASLISKFCHILINQLRLQLPSKLISNISQTDLQIAIIRTITPLLSYSETFLTRQDQDLLIQTIITVALPSIQTTPSSVNLETSLRLLIPTMHILTIALYVLPSSLKRHIPLILTRLQTRVSSGKFVSMIAPHLLELLLSLSNESAGLNLQERKCVVGLVVRCVQYARDWYVWRQKNVKTNNINEFNGVLNHGMELEADFSPSTITDTYDETNGALNDSILPNYILTLSYDVMSNWFLSVPLSEMSGSGRRQLAGFIMKNLINTDSGSISDQNLAFIDLIQRFTYSDISLGNSIPFLDPKFDHDKNSLGLLSYGQWIYGDSIITITTNKHSGESMIVIRRASGITQIWQKVTSFKDIDSQNETNVEEEEEEEEDSIQYTANHTFLQLIAHQSLVSVSATSIPIKPLLIPTGVSQISRSISTLDRIPVIQTHKIGLMYIAPGQSSELEILSNTSGSENYEHFVKGLGEKIRLKGNKKGVYTGGLDTENDADGKYAIIWKNKKNSTTQLVYHVTTMMTNNPNYSNYSNKKRHVGNNYVNVFFDESGINLDQRSASGNGDSFDFNVIKSQFNFINVVIQPHSVTFNSKSAGTSINSTSVCSSTQYRVKIYRRKGIPPIFSTCHFKIVPLEQIPHLIRNISLLCDQFAMVWHHNNSVPDRSNDDTANLYQSNWSHRVKQINAIRGRVTKYYEEQKSQRKGSIDEGRISESVDTWGEKSIDTSISVKMTSLLSRSNTSNSRKGISFNESSTENTVDMTESMIEFPELGDDLNAVVYRALEFNSFTK